MNKFDPRLTPARPDLAADFLQGQVEAKAFVAGEANRVNRPVVGLYASADDQTQLQTELLFGEEFVVYERKNKWAWGQANRDGFVGYVRADALALDLPRPDHWVCALRTPLYQWPDLKAPVNGFLHQNSLVSVLGQDDHYVDTGVGWVHVGDLKPEGNWRPDFVQTALAYLHTPYVWGGRSSIGLDCSALVQNALMAAGQPCLRDSDMQEASLGAKVELADDLSNLRRGDLLFWKGHVGLLVDVKTLLHANAHHMATAAEPVAGAIERIKKTAGPVQSVRRLDAVKN